ncbi:hypothetical protein HAX54_048857 [Datura stramonium]|uniref:Uncharacterized protein n=1 Tax=Datura stramonium TaxID=4076 RepID=A0ABS8WNI7_DATST|nr:hypothetical protein [Datura stramonium]
MNMFAALNDQEEVHDRPAKSTFISLGKSNTGEKNIPDNENNDEESHRKNSQNTRENSEDNQVEGRGEANKEVVIWTTEEQGSEELTGGSPSLLIIVLHQGGSSEAPELHTATFKKRYQQKGAGESDIRINGYHWRKCDERGFGQPIFTNPDKSFRTTRSLTLLSQRITGISTWERDGELEEKKKERVKDGRYLLRCIWSSSTARIGKHVDNP